MNKKASYFISGVVVAVILGGAVYFITMRKPAELTPPIQTATTIPPKPVSTDTEYRNTDYGFSITLPKSWKEYSVIEDEWEGDSLDAKGQVIIGIEKGPLISVRHPDWEYKSPRQDVPIMVFTLKQWNDMQAEKFHIGAAPINPSELGRNTKYVFALPARYNYAFLTGYEEVDQILKGDNFKIF